MVNSVVAASRQSAANCDGISDGGFLPKANPLIRDAGALGGSANGLIGNPDTLSSNLEALSFDPEALSFNPDALSFDPETLSFDVGALIFDVLGRKSNCKSLISSNLRINPKNHLKKGIKFGKPTGRDEGARRRAILTWRRLGRACKLCREFKWRLSREMDGA